MPTLHRPSSVINNYWDPRLREECAVFQRPSTGPTFITHSSTRTGPTFINIARPPILSLPCSCCDWYALRRDGYPVVYEDPRPLDLSRTSNRLARENNGAQALFAASLLPFYIDDSNSSFGSSEIERRRYDPARFELFEQHLTNHRPNREHPPPPPPPTPLTESLSSSDGEVLQKSGARKKVQKKRNRLPNEKYRRMGQEEKIRRKLDLNKICCQEYSMRQKENVRKIEEQLKQLEEDNAAKRKKVEKLSKEKQFMESLLFGRRHVPVIMHSGSL